MAPTFTCNICDSIFHTRRSLNAHAKTHGSQQTLKQRQCPKPQCLLILAGPWELKRHMKIHDPQVDSLFHCSFPPCTKTTREKFNMVTHERIHTGERPFMCAECKSTFSDGSAYIRHMKNIHDYRPYPHASCKGSAEEKMKYKKAARKRFSSKPEDSYITQGSSSWIRSWSSSDTDDTSSSSSSFVYASPFLAPIYIGSQGIDNSGVEYPSAHISIPAGHTSYPQHTSFGFPNLVGNYPGQFVSGSCSDPCMPPQKNDNVTDDLVDSAMVMALGVYADSFFDRPAAMLDDDKMFYDLAGLGCDAVLSNNNYPCNAYTSKPYYPQEQSLPEVQYFKTSPSPPSGSNVKLEFFNDWSSSF